MEKIDIFIIDDHRLFVDGVSMLLADETRFNIVGYVSSAKEFFECMDQLSVDVYLVDINIPEVSGIEITKRIKESQPQAKVLALTMYDDYEFVEKMLKNGADGYVLKSATIKELSTAILTLASGNKFFGTEIQEILFNKIGNKDAGEQVETADTQHEARLTKRETEILILIAREYSTQQIAEKLFISERTVETHRKNIFAKTKAKSIIGLSKYALQHGLISF